ncbi:MAG: hypothetical protein HYZ28_01270 [Myxococcales bacterium]|nr:hypothetical protein [Myxococcales bacterium]
MATRRNGRLAPSQAVRFEKLESGQRETNQRLGRIERTLEVSSRLFELMHQRLEHLEEGQHALVEGQQALVEGQKAVIERLDRLVEMGVPE